MLSMVAYEFCNVHHSRPISSKQGKKYLRVHFTLKCQVPDPERLPLEGSEMSQTGKQEGVDVFQIIRPRNETPNEDVFLLVAPSW